MNITATITAPAGYAVRLETVDGVVTVRAVRPDGENKKEAADHWPGLHVCGWPYHTDCPVCGAFSEEKLDARTRGRRP